MTRFGLAGSQQKTCARSHVPSTASLTERPALARHSLTTRARTLLRCMSQKVPQPSGNARSPISRREAVAFQRWHEPDDARVSSPDLFCWRLSKIHRSREWATLSYRASFVGAADAPSARDYHQQLADPSAKHRSRTAIFSPDCQKNGSRPQACEAQLRVWNCQDPSATPGRKH